MKKCKLLVPRVIYLVKKINREGIQAVKCKEQSIKKSPHIREL